MARRNQGEGPPRDHPLTGSVNAKNEQMAQANKNTASVHRFVETASIGAISTLCGSYSDLAGQAWVTSALALLDNDSEA